MKEFSPKNLSRRSFGGSPTAVGTSATIEAPAIAFSWLLRLRWLAVFGQFCTLIGVYELLQFEGLPYLILASMIAVTAATNTVLCFFERRLRRHAAQLLPMVLLFDTLMLTGMLHMSGGVENPFSLFYIVHVAMAAVALNLGWTSLMVALSSICFGWLSYGSHSFSIPTAMFWGIPLRTLGLWASVSIVAMVIAYFIERVSAALAERQEELTRVRSLVARNERLASLTTLAGGAAHELGTPLGTIAMVAHEMERAIEMLPENDPILDDLQLIRSQVDRCRGILDRMGLRGGDETAEHRIEVISVSELRDELCAKIPKRVDQLKVQHAADIDSVVACRQDLIRALVPIVKNALDASPAGVPVILEIERIGRILRFCVVDRGSGMSPDVLARIGEPFYTTKPPGKGMGLGLYLVRLLAERLGGKFEVESEKSVGTRAILEFPEENLSVSEGGV